MYKLYDKKEEVTYSHHYARISIDLTMCRGIGPATNCLTACGIRMQLICVHPPHRINISRQRRQSAKNCMVRRIYHVHATVRNCKRLLSVLNGLNGAFVRVQFTNALIPFPCSVQSSASHSSNTRHPHPSLERVAFRGIRCIGHPYLHSAR